MTRASGWGRWIGTGAAVVGLAASGMWAMTGVASATGSPKAKAQLLRLSDFPAGWTTTSSKTTATSPTTNQFAEIGACEGVMGSTVKTTVPDANVSFAKKKTAQFTVELVGLWPSAAAAKQVYAFFSAPKAPTCVGQALSKAVASGTATGNVTASDITVSKLSVPRLGSASTALHLVIPLTIQGSTVTMNANFVVIQKGNALAVVAPIGLSATMPAGFTVSIAKKAAARLH